MTVDVCQTSRNTSDKSLVKISGQLVFLNVALMGLEGKHNDRSLVIQMLRSVQAIQATCQRRRFSDLEWLAGDMEDLLDNIQGGLLPVSFRIVRLLRRGVDAFESGLDSLTQGLPVPRMLDDVRFAIQDMLAAPSIDCQKTLILN